MAQFAVAAAFGQIDLNGKVKIYGIPADKHDHDKIQQQEDNSELLKGFTAIEDSVRAALHQRGTEQWEIDLHVSVLKKEFLDKKLGRGIYADGPLEPADHTPVVMPPCTNLDFETGDFTGWSGFIGDNQTSSFGPLNNQVSGIVSTTQNAALSDATARHTIMTVAGGTDPCGGFPVVAPGGQYSVRLGGTTPNYQGEILEQTFTVSPSSTNVTYQYAVVLNDGGHAPADQPYFKIEVLDQNGIVIDTCVQYYVTAGGSIPGFLPCVAPTSYKPWTIVSIDLSAQVNQDVTIRFTVAGCTQSGHYGYAYIDAACSQLAVALNFCPGNPTVVLTAPSGFVSYQWVDGSGNPIPGATGQTYTIPNATVGTNFSVEMTAVTNCVSILTFTLQYTDIYSPITTTNIDCWGASNGQVSTLGNSGVPPYTYQWNNGPTSPTQANLPPGMYVVTTTDSLGCQVIDTAYVVEPPRLDTSAIVYSFCPGDQEVTFVAPPGYSIYTWTVPSGVTIIAGQNTSTIIVTGAALGQEISCVYQTPPACAIYDSIFVGLIPPTVVFNPDSTNNVFTPNGDGFNDYFFPYFDYTVTQGWNQLLPVSQQLPQPNGDPTTYDFERMYIGTYELHVYDRWGMEVYTTNEISAGWDGKVNSNSKEANPGVYYWIAKMTSRCKEDQTPVESTGFVHLIRK